MRKARDGALDEEQRDLLEDIFGRTERQPGTHPHPTADRADRIVNDMLMMSRGIRRPPTHQHQQPAGTNTPAWPITAPEPLTPTSNWTLQYDFDDTMGEIDVNPQDLGRVFPQYSQQRLLRHQRKKG